jgi:hypothetical protein
MAAQPQIPDEQTLALVRERLTSGRLPRAIPETVYAGRGTSMRCAACSQPITPQQIEYEVAISGTKPLVFHMQCHSVWLAECRQNVGVSAGRRETHCTECDVLLERYSNAVESFSLAIGDYWSDRKAGSLCSVAQTERQLTKKDLSEFKKALMDHYASCVNRKAMFELGVADYISKTS